VVRGATGKAARLVGGRYELEGLIGQGGVGEVWRARHVALNSHVAIKLLQVHSAEKDNARRRFTTEAQITAQLKSPNAVQVFDFGVTDEGQPYLVMELLEGETLGERIARSKRLGIEETGRLLGQAVKALQRAHQLGIVHRDFKPDNVIICVDDEGRDLVKVLDFGVAKLAGVLDDGDGAAPRSRGSVGQISLTRTGTALGTPLYMAPEQVRDSADVDHRADIWALGVVAFECLTGRAPFTGETLAELFERIQTGLHKSATFLEPSIPASFDSWFDRACALDPAKRFPDAALAFKQLTAALQGTPASPERVVVVPTKERADAAARTLEVTSQRPRRKAVPTPSTDAKPKVRARHLKDWLLAAARDEDPWRARFFAALPDETRDVIEAAIGSSWLPVDLHVQLADIMQDSYGPARAHEHYRRSFAESVRGGIFGPVVRTGMRLFGTTPAAFLRWADRGWDTSFRSCGGLIGESEGPGRGRLIYKDLPPVCLASDAWLGSAQGSAYGAYDVCEVSGVVRIDTRRRSEGSIQLVLEWTDRRP
jgi:serine/threonine protein kinase